MFSEGICSDYTGHETESGHIPPFIKFKSNRKQLKLRKNYQIIPDCKALLEGRTFFMSHLEILLLETNLV